jgi:hypothetical protein
MSMTAPAQLKATAVYRKRAAQRGLVRVDVQVPKQDRSLILELAERLRGDATFAAILRQAVDAASGRPMKSGLDIFASDLPDAVFDDVFARPRERQSREVDL